MDEFMMYTVGLEILNAILLGVLLVVFVPNYRAMRSMTGLGLILFSIVLLIQNVVGLFFHFTGEQLYEKMVAFQECGLQFIETVALLTLVYAVWKE